MEVIEIINGALNRVRKERNLSSDAALATIFGVSDMAIYRWRRGEVSKAARVLIPIVCDYCGNEHPPANQST